MSKISTSIKGNVREHHFRCTAEHEFSILASVETEIVPSLGCCPVDGCNAWATNLGDNSAAVSKDVVDLLEN